MKLRWIPSGTVRPIEIAILTVAGVTGSSFGARAHSAVERNVGLTDAEIAELLQGGFTSIDATEQAVVTIARQLILEGAAPEHQRLEESTLAEVATLVGYFRLLAQLLGCFGGDDEGGV